MTPNDIPETARKRMLLFLPQNSICVEVGVWRGKFAREILTIIKPQKLILIDPWIYDQPIKEKWMYVPWGGIKSQKDFEKDYQSVVDYFGTRPDCQIIRGYSHDVVSTIPDNYIDWVYIDGAHDYESVKEDVFDWYNKIKIGGYIWGDDYDWGDGHPVELAIKEILPKLKHDSWHLDENQWMFRKI